MKKATNERWAIICNERYGIYYGRVISHDVGTRVVVAEDCRHVCRWYGRTGGITSLAAHGLCGPRAGESRIGAPCKATLTGVVNVFDVSAEARKTFDAANVQ